MYYGVWVVGVAMKYVNRVRRVLRSQDLYYDGLGRSGMRGWFAHVAVLLILAASLAISVSWLVSAVGLGAHTSVDGWWGARQGSYWEQVGSAKNRPTLKSRDLVITIHGDELTAQYTLTAPAKTALSAETLTAGNGDTGNDLVNNVLGSISIAEFRYGLTGSHYTPEYLTFHGPQLTVSGGMTTVAASSDPLRLDLHHQEISVAEPPGIAVKGPDKIQIYASGIHVLAASGAQLADVAKGKADLYRDGKPANITVSAGSNSGQDWLAGLRSLGGVTIPVVNGLFTRLSGLFDYIVLFWALSAIRKAHPSNQIFAVARSIVFTIVAGLAAVAFLGFMLDVGAVLFPDQNSLSRAEAVAGPVALLVAGAGLVWPAVCFRIGSGKRARYCRASISRSFALPFGSYCMLIGSGKRARYCQASISRSFVLLFAACYIVLFGYWIALYEVMGINLFTNFHVLAGTAMVVILVWLLVWRLLGIAGTIPWLVSAGMLSVVLGATIAWPVLYFGSWTPSWDDVPHVNVLGKWVFLVVAILTALGLCVMTFRVTEALMMSRRRQWVLTIGISIVIGAAVLPDTIRYVQLADPHASGWEPANLWDLFDALPQLLDWLLLALAIVVAMSLPATRNARPLARRIVISIGLLLLYWNITWLYVPVTLIVGLIMLDRLVFPKQLADKKVSRHPGTSAQAIRESIAGWRCAEFAAKQRQTLASSSDALLELVKDNRPNYAKRVESLARVQDYLAEERDRWQNEARQFEAQAFDQRGKTPVRRTAVTGAVLGAILGIIPVSITLLTTHPAPDSSGFPMLNFFGGTAWSLFGWTVLGWFIGYSLPLMRGRNGSEKALWLFIASIGATLPTDVIWSDSGDWLQTLIWSVELLIFLMAAGVYLCDFRILRVAGLRVVDWFTVQNWHFIVTWSTALVAAIGTALVTFLSTTAADFSHQAFPGPSSPPAAQSTVHQSSSGPG